MSGFGNVDPFRTNGPPTTNTNTINFTGGPWTFTSSTDAIFTLAVSDVAAASGSLVVGNNTGTALAFTPYIQGFATTTRAGLSIYGNAATDSGTAGLLEFYTRIGSTTAVATRPLFTFTNGAATLVLSGIPLNSGTNSAISWGTTAGAAPAFTTRSAGNRLILYSAISGTKVDNAIGVAASGADTWYSVQEATSSYTHKFYAGTTVVASIRGDGLLTTTGAQVHKLRVATATPVTVSAATDYVVCTNLGTPGAVAVNLPAGVAGQEFVIKDDKGDANVNNITITPAAGNIDGAATLVLNTAYAYARLVYNGTQWNRIG